MILTREGWLDYRTYGQAIIVPVTLVKAAYTLFCLVTPFTNFTLPFVLPKLRGITWRYDATKR